MVSFLFRLRALIGTLFRKLAAHADLKNRDLLPRLNKSAHAETYWSGYADLLTVCHVAFFARIVLLLV
jgi:hypothetical protein